MSSTSISLQDTCPPADWLLPGGTRPRCCVRHQGQYDAYAAAVRRQEPCLLCRAPPGIPRRVYPH